MKRFVCLLSLSAGFLGSLRASEQMRSAQALEAGKLGFSVYTVNRENKDLEFSLGGNDLIQVPLSNGTTAQFLSGSDTELEFDGEGRSTMLSATWRPADGLHYIVKAGLGDYEVRLPSSSVTNVLETASPGTVLGFEAAWNIVSHSPVTPAVSLSLGYTWSDYALRRLKSGGDAPVAVDQRFTLTEWQGALSASKRWKTLDPYAGLRFFRQEATLFDHASAERVRGKRDGYSPFLGLRWEFLPKESLVIEASAADEVVLSAGLSVGF